MADRLRRADPTVETVKNLLPAGTAGNSIAEVMPVHVVRIPLSETGGTANAGYVSWINPERFTIGVLSVAVHYYTTGTGTFVMGIGDDGTGSSSNLFLTGTMNTGVAKAIVYRAGRGGTEGAGSAGTTVGAAELIFLGPGGTGTNNSIIAKTSETATTAKGDLFITYFVNNR